MTLAWLVLQFSVCAALIGRAGFMLSTSADRLARHHGWGRGWVGLALHRGPQLRFSRSVVAGLARANCGVVHGTLRRGVERITQGRFEILHRLGGVLALADEPAVIVEDLRVVRGDPECLFKGGGRLAVLAQLHIDDAEHVVRLRMRRHHADSLQGGIECHAVIAQPVVLAGAFGMNLRPLCRPGNACLLGGLHFNRALGHATCQQHDQQDDRDLFLVQGDVLLLIPIGIRPRRG